VYFTGQEKKKENPTSSCIWQLS